MPTPPRIALPSPDVPAIDPQTGHWTTEWYVLLQTLIRKLNEL
jgi:hypothetical protein